MKEIKIEIEQKNEDLVGEKNPTWTPLSNGNIFESYISSKDKISDKDKKNLREDSIKLLSRCINPNKIENTNINSTGLCFGQIQSGKTTSMEAIFSLAADNNFKILILLTGSVGPLVDQNTSRIDEVLDDRKYDVLRNVEDEWEESRFLDILKNSIYDWNNSETEEDDQKTMVILSMKNPSRIRKIIKLFEEACNKDYSKFDRLPTLIIDDECDHHSLNSRASKNDPDSKDDIDLYEIKTGDTAESICEYKGLDPEQLFEINPGKDLQHNFDNYIGDKINIDLDQPATHETIRNLRKIFKFHSFLGYTATPNAPLLINTFNNLSPSFGKIIRPGEDYTGLEYFFGSRSKIDRFVKQINEDLSEYEKGGEERPGSLRDAYTYFLTSVACALCLKKDKKPEKENMTMMVHPSGLTGTHEKYINWLKGLQDDLRRALKNKDTDEFKSLEKEIQENLKEIKKHTKLKIPEMDERFWNKFQSRDCLGITPIPFNANRKQGRNRIPKVDWKRNYSNILVGGFGLDRGYTVEGLTVTYLTRPLGGKQEDTLLQRARFMGYQGKNSDFIKLYFTDDVLNFFEGEYDRNKNLMKVLDRFLETNQNLKNWRRFWFGRDRGEYRLTRAGVMNNINLSRRSQPYDRSIRCRFSHLLDQNKLEKNKMIYEILTKQYSNQFVKLDESNDIKNKHPWVKGLNIKIMKNISIKTVLDSILNKYEFENRDLNNFSVIMTLIDHYLDPVQGENESEKDYIERKQKRANTECPIILFRENEKNPRKPWSKSTNPEEILKGPITTSQGQTQGFGTKNDNTLFPGDIRIHMEYLNQISNDMNCFNIPTLQLHEINVYEKQKGDGDCLKEKVPYLSFFLPNNMYQDIIVGYRE